MNLAELLFDALYLAVSIYVARTWVGWSRTNANATEARGRTSVTVIGFGLSTVSLLLLVALRVHAHITGGLPSYHPVLMWAIFAGFTSALAAIVAAIVGTGPLVNPTLYTSLFCMLIWFAGALAQ